MARQKKQVLTSAEQQQEIQQLQQENARIQARLAQLAGGQATNQQRSTQPTLEQAGALKVKMASVPTQIPEAELEALNYCVENIRSRNPKLTVPQARGVILTQGAHTARPRMERQALAARRRQQPSTSQQPTTAAPA
jgi:hypothetical protein